MKELTAVVEHCSNAGLSFGHVPGFPGAHSEGKTLEELDLHLQEVMAMLLEELSDISREFISKSSPVHDALQ